MTNEEAARILDSETTIEALAEIEYYAGFSGKSAKLQAVNRACELAAAVLRARTETNCDFCKEIDQSWDDGDAHEFRMNGNGLFYHDYLLGWEGIRVNYCPMCGRRLDGTLDNYRKSEEGTI